MHVVQQRQHLLARGAQLVGVRGGVERLRGGAGCGGAARQLRRVRSHVAGHRRHAPLGVEVGAGHGLRSAPQAARAPRHGQQKAGRTCRMLPLRAYTLSLVSLLAGAAVVHALAAPDLTLPIQAVAAAKGVTPPQRKT